MPNFRSWYGRKAFGCANEFCILGAADNLCSPRVLLSMTQKRKWIQQLLAGW
jgi:hypothetical protein